MIFLVTCMIILLIIMFKIITLVIILLIRFLIITLLVTIFMIIFLIMILLMIVKKNTLSHLLGGANARGGEAWSEVNRTSVGRLLYSLPTVNNCNRCAYSLSRMDNLRTHMKDHIKVKEVEHRASVHKLLHYDPIQIAAPNQIM